MLQLATKNKANIERALQDFLSLASMEQQGRDNVGAILGMSIAYQLLKQTPRARNQLKRVFKRGWNFDDAEYLERCWLLLADIYIQVLRYYIQYSVRNLVRHFFDMRSKMLKKYKKPHYNLY